ncbi:MAG: family 78 glycoside hydrolase catalytic domain [Prevotellaceae bacterium]|nr:family 78 glycoside hydrolase catalytic domain [Prevotellaceae bacterium]
MKKTLFLILACIMSTVVNAGEIEIKRLTVEGRECPLGIDEVAPRLGWQLFSDKKDVVQKSYRIIVASSKDRIDANIGDVWDSGKVVSDSSQWVDYKSVPLLPNREYYWKVKVNTNKGASEWSSASRWTTGLMSQDNWKGTWIGLDSLMEWDAAVRHSRISSRYIRKTFSLHRAVKRATIHIAGLGLYTLYINGKRIGDDVLTPLPTDYTRSVIYNTYDVTGIIAQNQTAEKPVSDNAIGVVLAGGHYFAQTQNYQTNVRTTYSYPKLIANLIVEYTDGTSETISTDTTWRLNADGAVRYANEYDGEMFDARLLFHGWDTPSFDDSKWRFANEVNAPGGVLRGNLSPAMSVYSTEKPVRISRYSNRFIVDFGTNNAGRVRFRYTTALGDTVRIRHAEMLESGDSTLYVDNLRSAEATTYYIGDGNQRSWAPDFTFYGFRFVEVTGVDDLQKDDISRELIADRMNDEGTYFIVEDTESDTILNAIVANARRGVRSNYKGMPIDCPQRDERMPWLGDRTTGCLGESYLLDNHCLYAKWVRDICESQREDGSLSDVAPAYWRLYNNNVTWPAALPFACDMLYRQYGDIRPMRESYRSIKKFLDLVKEKHIKNGIVTYDRYGDWCVPPESPDLVHSKDSTRITDGSLIATAYYYYLCRMMQRYAPFVEAADTSYFASTAEMMRNAFNDEFLINGNRLSSTTENKRNAFNDEILVNDNRLSSTTENKRNDFNNEYIINGNYSNGTVTANLLPLAMDMVPEESRKAVHDRLINTIVVKNNTHISAGVIGIQWLMRYLSDTGNGDIAYKLATNETYPGWGYMVKRGATTIWELWNGDTANPSMNSANHVMLLGDLLPWCYERIGGIMPDNVHTGFKHIILKPDFTVSRLRSVSAAHQSPYGQIVSEWHRDGKTIVWNITIPANTTAEIHLPNGKIKLVGSGKRTIKCKEQ